MHVLTNAKDLINQLSENNIGNLLFYTFYDSIAFVGQTVFQSFTTNVVVLEEKMVNKGLRRFFLVNGKRIRQLQQHFACLKKATFRSGLFVLIWDLNLREKKYLFFSSQREENEKVPNNIRLL